MVGIVVFRQYTVHERVVDLCIHAVGVAASLIALGALLVIGVTSDAALWGVGLTIYGLALVATFGLSAGYHIAVRPKLKALMRRFDHAAIFLMIAGTYTPFILIKMNNAWGLGLLATVGPWRRSASPSSCSPRVILRASPRRSISCKAGRYWGPGSR